MATGKLPLTSKLLRRVSVLALLALAVVAVAGQDRKRAVAASTEPAVLLRVPASTLRSIESGDLVFRTGRDMVSRIVLSQGDQARFSHVGIIVRRPEGIFVAHSIPKEENDAGGVVLEPISKFFSSENAVDGAFYRVSGVSRKARKAAADYALTQLGKPFDDEFSIADNERIYCSELVIKAYLAKGVDLRAGSAPVTVMMVQEPVFPPESIRHNKRISAIFELPQPPQT